MLEASPTGYITHILYVFRHWQKRDESPWFFIFSIITMHNPKLAQNNNEKALLRHSQKTKLEIIRNPNPTKSHLGHKQTLIEISSAINIQFLFSWLK